MTVGQLMDLLARFPRDTPVLKTNDEGCGYDNIPDTGSFEYYVINAFAVYNWQAEYIDCSQDTDGAFKAIVL